jgi:hypothetical protein
LLRPTANKLLQDRTPGERGIPPEGAPSPIIGLMIGSDIATIPPLYASVHEEC